MARIRAEQLDAATLERFGLAAPKPRRKGVRKPGPGADLPPLHPGDILIALDISSSRTGHALGVVGPCLEPIVESCGAITPKSGRPSWERIDHTTRHLTPILAGCDPARTRVVLEWSAGKVAGRLRGSNPSGLAVLGQAQGACYQQVIREGFRVELVGETDWTAWKGKGVPKADRVAWAKRHVPAYARWLAEHADSGGDVGDATALLCWRCIRAQGLPGIDWRDRVR